MRPIALALLVTALAAVPAQAADPVVVAAGDVACDPGDTDYHDGDGTVPPAATPGRCHQGYTANLIESLAPTHVLALGDLQYENGALAKFEASYDPSWGRVLDITKPVPGNHEYGASGSDFDANAPGYFTYFEDELAAEGPDAGDPQKGWYSFNVQAGTANWHIVALNSECAAGLRVSVNWDGDCDAGSEEEQWLRADLAADTSDCTIAYWHHPRFSSGNLGDNLIMAPIWDALYEDYADIVLAGHDHNYERFAPKGTTGSVEAGRGIREWVVGTGGKDLRALEPPKPGSEVLSNAAHGVLKLTLHGPGSGHPYGWYEWQFLNDGVSGTPFSDLGSADCVGPPRPAVTRVAAKVVADRVAPKLSKLRLSRKRFRVGRGATARSAAVRRGTVIGYTLSEPATANLKIERRKLVRKGGKRVRRYRKAGTLKRKGKAGRRRVKFSGRIGKRALKPGLYRLTIAVKDSAGNAGRPRRLFFRVVR